LARLRYVAGQQASKVRRPSRTSWGDRLGAQTLHDDGLAFVDYPMHMAVEALRPFNLTRGNNG